MNFINAKAARTWYGGSDQSCGKYERFHPVRNMGSNNEDTVGCDSFKHPTNVVIKPKIILQNLQNSSVTDNIILMLVYMFYMCEN